MAYVNDYNASINMEELGKKVLKSVKGLTLCQKE